MSTPILTPPPRIHTPRTSSPAPTASNVSASNQDPSCPDTQLDGTSGIPGMFAFFMRRMVNKLLPEWYYPPPNFQAFDKQGVLPTPAMGVTSTIFSLAVPQGYASVGRRLSFNVIGPGFVQGSGSLIFSVTVDNAPYRNYATIL